MSVADVRKLGLGLWVRWTHIRSLTLMEGARLEIYASVVSMFGCVAVSCQMGVIKAPVVRIQLINSIDLF